MGIVCTQQFDTEEKMKSIAADVYLCCGFSNGWIVNQPTLRVTQNVAKESGATIVTIYFLGHVGPSLCLVQ